MADFRGKGVDHVDEAATRVGDAAGEERVEVARGVGGECVAHLDRGREVGRAVGQDVGEIFARVLAAGEEQGDAVAVAGGDDSGGEHAGPRVGRLVGGGRAPLLGGEREDLHRGVVVVDDLALGRLPQQLVPGGHERRQGVAHELPLRGGRQRNPHRPLQGLDTMKRQTTAVLEQADHRRGRRVVLCVAHAGGRRGGEDLAAQVAPPAVARVDGGAQRGHPGDPHQHRGLRQRIDLALGAPGAAVAAVQRGVGNRHPVRPGVGGGAGAAVTRARGARRRRVGRGPRARPGRRARGDDRARLLGLRAEEEAAQAVERGLLRLEFRRDERERVHGGLQLRVVVWAQRRLGALDDRAQLVEAQLEGRGRRPRPGLLAVRATQGVGLVKRARKSGTRG